MCCCKLMVKISRNFTFGVSVSVFLSVYFSFFQFFFQCFSFSVKKGTLKKDGF